MKIKIFSGAVTGLLLAGLPFVGGCKDDAPPTLTQVAPATAGVQPVVQAEVVPPVPVAVVDEVVLARPVPAVPAAEQPLPSDIRLSANAAQIVKLAQAGVDESVMMSFIKNSGGTFNLGSDEIIYLKDIGVEGTVVTAMIERDRALGIGQAPAPVAPVPQAVTVAAEPLVVAQQPEQPVTVNQFYTTLSPYGSWVEVEGYGRCWQPTVVVSTPTWQPYCDRGHWVYTDCGWYWASDYSWGYTTFHYGRWFRHGRYGWCWSPDTVWGPAWVTWRTSSDYCGWAPLPPHAVFVSGGGFTYYGRSVSVGFDFGLSVNCFTFLPFSRFCDPYPRRHVVSHKNVTKIYNNTTIINNYGSGNRNTVINHGVPVERVSAATRTTIKPVAVRETPSAFHRGSDRLERRGNETVLYRPTTSPASTRGEATRRTETQTSAPARAVLPRTNPGEDRRRTETTVQTPATTPGRPTTTPVNTTPSTGSRVNTPRPAVQPRTSTTVQTETAPRSTTTGTSPLVIGGRSQERPTVSTRVSAPPSTQPAQPAQPATTRSSSSFYTSPRFESPRVQATVPRSATPTPTPTPSAPVSTRTQRQESSRPAPVVSHRDTESSNPSASRGRSSTSSVQTAPQSTRSEKSSSSQSRSERSEKKSKN